MKTNLKTFSTFLYCISFITCAFGTPDSGYNPNAVTVAGAASGTSEYLLDHPYGMYIDGYNNIYIADTYNHRIQKWAQGATSGITIAGGNGQGNAADQLNTPTGVFVDNTGNVYIADQNNHRIQKWLAGAASGITVAGGSGPGNDSASLYNPHGLYVTNAGDIYIADQRNNRIQKWEAGASYGITLLGGGVAGISDSQLYSPNSVCLDALGNIYISDYSNHRIQKLPPNTTHAITVAGNAAGVGGTDSMHLALPNGVYVDTNGDVYVADGHNNRMQKWQSGASYGTTEAGGNTSLGSAPDQLIYPSAVFIAANRDMFVLDTYNNRVQKFSALSTIVNDIYDETNGICIYPNPASEVLHIATKENQVKIAEIYDSKGSLMQKEILSNKSNLSIAELSKGIYMLKLINANTDSYYKFIKE